MKLVSAIKKISQERKVDLRTEMMRRKSQRQKMLEEFKKNGELYTADLMRIGTGCSSRLKELRNDGHIIVAVYERPGVWRYVYRGKRKIVVS